MAWSQKFRLTPVIQPPTLLQNVLFCLFLLTSFVQNVCVCTTDFVSAGKNTVLLLVTVCEKVASRLNKHDDVIEWNCAPYAHHWCYVAKWDTEWIRSNTTQCHSALHYKLRETCQRTFRYFGRFHRRLIRCKRDLQWKGKLVQVFFKCVFVYSRIVIHLNDELTYTKKKQQQIKD